MGQKHKTAADYFESIVDYCGLIKFFKRLYRTVTSKFVGIKSKEQEERKCNTESHRFLFCFFVFTISIHALPGRMS